MGQDVGRKRIGSVFIVDVPGRAEAEVLSADGPFTWHRLVERVIIARFLDITRGKPAFEPAEEYIQCAANTS